MAPYQGENQKDDHQKNSGDNNRVCRIFHEERLYSNIGYLPINHHDYKRSAQRPDGKPGRELAAWAEGFFRLEFLVLLFQDKRTSLRGNERMRIHH
jgi:hypothetical protein